MWSDKKIAIFWSSVAAGVLLFIALLMIALPSYGRYQKRANARNEITVNHIRIQQQEQRVKIAKQNANIRYQNAVGVKRAQDEIQKTLTPIYVQFEMVDALKAIAQSGSNNSVVYIPSGANGIPLIQGAGPSVGQPNPHGGK
jgi:type II secretory pathway pseudopilin PulG